jgi:tetratricopeptide (TPR) repeat protein
LIAAALDWDRKQEGPRGVSVARDYEAAGLSKQFEGDLDMARKFYSNALAIRLASQGRLHPKVSEDLNELGTVAYLQGDDAAAEKYWRQCIALDQQVLGPNHPDVAATLNNLARVMIQQRKFREALPLLTRSVNINLAQRSATHDDLSFIFANLAIAKRGVGARHEAEALFQKALAAAEAHENRILAPTLVDLANLRCERGAYGNAMQLLDRAAPIMKADYPDDAWRSAWVENSRGACLLRQGRTAAARALLTASSAIILKRWPANSLFGFDVQQRMRALSARI